MSLLRKLLGRDDAREAMAPLYAHVVAIARAPHWYAQGGAPDTVDGRFDMVAAVLALVLIRLEREPDPARGIARSSALLTERFVADMDAQLRQIGIGDVVVGKHVGKMMGALGGRLGAYRVALADDGDAALGEAVTRNVYRGEERPAAERDHLVAALRALDATLAATPAAALLAGRIGP